MLTMHRILWLAAQERVSLFFWTALLFIGCRRNKRVSNRAALALNSLLWSSAASTFVVFDINWEWWVYQLLDMPMCLETISLCWQTRRSQTVHWRRKVRVLHTILFVRDLPGMNGELPISIQMTTTVIYWQKFYPMEKNEDGFAGTYCITCIEINDAVSGTKSFWRETLKMWRMYIWNVHIMSTLSTPLHSDAVKMGFWVSQPWDKLGEYCR